MASSIVPFAGGETLVYTPEQAKRSVEELADAIEELSRRIQVLENLFFMARAVPPEKPRAPMIAYADGVNWIPPQPVVPPPTVTVDDTWDAGSGAVVDPGPGPGSMAGYYEFREDGQWHKL